MVWFASFGTGAGGRAGAKGGRGTDCREGPEDEAEKNEKEGERETEEGRHTDKHTQRVNNSPNIVSFTFNFALKISKVYDDINAPQREESAFKLDRLLFRETIGHKMH